MNKLYKVVCTVYVLAESETKAETVCRFPDGSDVEAEEIKSMSNIPRDWKDAFPYTTDNYLHENNQLTIRQLIEGI